MVRIVWGVILVALGSFVIWQAIDLLATVKSGNDLVAEFSRSLGQRPAKSLDAFSLTDFWGRLSFGVVCLFSGSLLIYFGDIARKKEIISASIQRRLIPDDSDPGSDW